MPNQPKDKVNRGKLLKSLRVPETTSEMQLRNIASEIINDLHSENFHSIVTVSAFYDKETGIGFKMYYTDIMAVETLLGMGMDKLRLRPNIETDDWDDEL